MGVDLRGRNAGVECGAHVTEVGRQKQVGVQRFEVAPGRLAAREAAALNGQAVVLRRAKHPHATDRVVARKNHHLDVLRAHLVEGQKLFHQGESHTGLGRHFQPIELQLHVGAVVGLLEHLVLFFKVEQGA